MFHFEKGTYACKIAIIWIFNSQKCKIACYFIHNENNAIKGNFCKNLFKVEREGGWSKKKNVHIRGMHFYQLIKAHKSNQT